ncbi:MAG TPA: hypothetical protein VGZ00_08385 [Candidatus Baltobacteraceae bacterium]|jgi:hypothetical protein|nr:hypothetical protein [Candidatus Baltobacteraceae bacterium]
MSASDDASSIPSVPRDVLFAALGDVVSTHAAEALPVKRGSVDPIRISFNGPDPISEVIRQRGVADTLARNAGEKIVAFEGGGTPVGREISIDQLPHTPIISRKAVFVDKTLNIDTEYHTGHVFFGPGSFFRGDDGKLHMNESEKDGRPRVYLVDNAQDHGWSREIALPVAYQHDDSARLYSLLVRQWTAMHTATVSRDDGGSDYIIDASRACRAPSGEWIRAYNTCVVGTLVDEGGHKTAHALERFLAGMAEGESDAWSMVYAIDEVRWNQIIQSSEWGGLDLNSGSWLNPRFNEGSQRRGSGPTW